MSQKTIKSDIPARLDRLPWCRWHVRILIALGTSWMLDGLEVTLVGSLAGILTSPSGLRLTDTQVTAAATTYLIGAVTGALLFGYLTDRLGRRKLFLITVATYSLGTLATAFSWGFVPFAIFRSITGIGIGGEYSAINSAVDELIPGKVRGAVDLIVNGTFWVGGAVGSLAALYLLSGHSIGGAHAWRYAFGIGGSLGGVILLLRLSVPESPRWLMLRGREQQADDIICKIEEKVAKVASLPKPSPEGIIGVPHRQRDLPARDTRLRHRHLLCHGNTGRRCWRSAALRLPGQHGLTHAGRARLHLRSDSHAVRRSLRDEDRRRSRRKVSRVNLEATAEQIAAA
jgi:MFS family permease